MRTAVKAIIIIACIATGAIAFLLTPIIPTEYKGSYNVDYSVTTDKIDLIVGADISSIAIIYSNDPSADLINISYKFTIGHSILFDPGPPTITFNNHTIGTLLIATLIVDFPALYFASTWYSLVLITLNPTLLCNFTISTDTGNIDIDTTNFQNKTFTKIDLSASTGNIEVDLMSSSKILGDLHILTTTGNKDINIAENSEIGGTLQVNGTTGNVDLVLKENTTLNNNFIVKTTTGNINTYLYNISLNNNEITGIIQSTTGNIETAIRQLLDPAGNLTLNSYCTTGNNRLTIKLEADYLSSEIHPTTGTGTITYGLHLGFNKVGADLISTLPDQSSNFDVNIVTTTGNINLLPERS